MPDTLSLTLNSWGINKHTTVVVSIKEFWSLCSHGKTEDLRDKVLLRLQSVNPKEKVQYGDQSVKLALLERDPDDCFRTAWLKCCVKGSLSCLKELMKYSQPDQTINQMHDAHGNNGFMLCCKHGYLDCASFLVDECGVSTDVDLRNNNGESCLILAARARKNSKELVELIVQLGVDANIKSTSGYTAAIIAADRGKADCLKAILSFRRSVLDDLPEHRKLYHNAFESKAKADHELAKKGKHIVLHDHELSAQPHGQKDHISVAADHRRLKLYSKLLREDDKNVVKFFDGICALEIAEMHQRDWKALTTLLLGEFNKLSQALPKNPSAEDKAKFKEASDALEEMQAETAHKVAHAERAFRHQHTLHHEKTERLTRVFDRLVDLEDGDAEDRTVLYVSSKLKSDRCFTMTLHAIVEDCRYDLNEAMRHAEIEATQPSRLALMRRQIEAAVNAGKATKDMLLKKHADEAAAAAIAAAAASSKSAVSGQSQLSKTVAATVPAGRDAKASAEAAAPSPEKIDSFPTKEQIKENDAKEIDTAKEAAMVSAESAGAAREEQPAHDEAAAKFLRQAHANEILKMNEAIKQKISIPTAKGFNAVFLCAIYGHKARLQTLLKHKAIMRDDNDGRSPLFLALAWESLPSSSPAASESVPNECVDVLCETVKATASKNDPPRSIDQIKALYRVCVPAQQAFSQALRDICSSLQGDPRDSSRRYPGLVYYFDHVVGGLNGTGAVGAYSSALSKYYNVPLANEGNSLDALVLEASNLAFIYLNNSLNEKGNASGQNSGFVGAAGHILVDRPLEIVGGVMGSTADAIGSVTAPLSFLNPLNMISSSSSGSGNKLNNTKDLFDPAYRAASEADNAKFKQILAAAAVATAAVLGGCETNYNMSPLQWAAQCGLGDCVAMLLLQPGVSTEPLPRSIANEDIANALRGHCFLQAVQHGLQDRVRELLASPDVNINMAAHDGKTGLHFAAASGRVDIVELLMADPRTNTNILDSEGLNPLAMACRGSFDTFLYHWLAAVFGGLEMLNAVLKWLAMNRPDAVKVRWKLVHGTKSSGDGEEEPEEEEEEEEEEEDEEENSKGKANKKKEQLTSVLEVLNDNEIAKVEKFFKVPAYIPGYLEVPVDIPEALNSLADEEHLHKFTIPLVPGRESKLALSMLSRRLWQNVMRKIETAKAKGGNGSSAAPPSPQFHGFSKVVQRLLFHPSTTHNTINARDAFGMTPLFFAAINGNEAALEQLLCEPYIYVNCPDNDDDTPLIAAAARGHAGCVRILLMHSEIDVNRGGNFGKTDHSVAGQQARSEFDKVIVDPGQRQQLLRQTHKNRMMRRKNQKLLSVDGFVETWVVLGESIVPPETGSEANRSLRNTALICAASNGHAGIVRMLVQHPSTDVNRRNSDGYTALGLARTDEIRFILREMGAEPSQADLEQMLLIHRRHVLSSMELLAELAPLPPTTARGEGKDAAIKTIRNNLCMPAPPEFEAPNKMSGELFASPATAGQRMWINSLVSSDSAAVDAVIKVTTMEPLTQSTDDPITMLAPGLLAALASRLNGVLWYLDSVDVCSLTLADALFNWIRYRVDQPVDCSVMCADPLRQFHVASHAAFRDKPLHTHVLLGAESDGVGSTGRSRAGTESALNSHDTQINADKATFTIPVFALSWTGGAPAAQRSSPAMRRLRQAVGFALSDHVWGHVWKALPAATRGDLVLGEYTNLRRDGHPPAMNSNIRYSACDFNSMWDSAAASPPNEQAKGFVKVVRELCEQVQKRALSTLSDWEKAVAAAAVATGTGSEWGGYGSGCALGSVGDVAHRLHILDEKAWRTRRAQHANDKTAAAAGGDSSGGLWAAWSSGVGTASVVDLSACAPAPMPVLAPPVSPRGREFKPMTLL